MKTRIRFLIAALVSVVLGVAPTPRNIEARSVAATKVSVNFPVLLASLESATGLSFYAKCSTCTMQGWVMHNGGVVTVHVYEDLIANQPQISSTTWNAAWTAAITDTINAHTP